MTDQHALDDLREHEASPECWCGPREESDGVWVHNSLLPWAGERFRMIHGTISEGFDE